ncbi:MAG TPA: HAD-IC family P-type ATPase [Nitrospiria bacterium]|jgi:sodium/potassium-transporting ATPase subunit alpha
MESKAHRIDLNELFKQLASSPSGLTSQEKTKRQKEKGLNLLEALGKPPLIFQFGKHLVNFFAILLWIGALLAFIAEKLSPGEGNIYIAGALTGVVILNAIFTFIQEYQSEKIIESFHKMMPVTIDALRDGTRKKIEAKGVVMGDIIFLEEGDRVPADGRLIEENSLKVDHSSLTGEFEPQLRTLECTHENIIESRNMVFSGTLVLSGHGKAVVYGIGMDTQLGRIAKLTKRTEKIDSPLKKELNYFIRIISTIAIGLGITFFTVGIFLGGGLMASMIFAIGIIVANVPEGLLPTVTLSLSMASKRMAKKKALIKSLESVETLGSTTIICTDKTGTLTENRILVNTLVLDGDEKLAKEDGMDQISGMDELLRISILSNNARVSAKGNFHGDPTDVALLKFAQRFRDIHQVVNENERIEEFPFDSVKKRMLTINKVGDKKTAYLKGAPEVVMEKCTRILHQGKMEGFDESQKENIRGYYRNLANRGERVLALALNHEFSGVEENFIFVGLIGMNDPLRKDIPEAISTCKRAGIKVIMITGDYGATAEAVAKMAGLVGDQKANLMTGIELDSCDEPQLKEFLKKDSIIFARTSPFQKLRITKTLQSMGEVVTVTGDGVNDAPALKHADMGVAMGLSGTEVAREAADMVLLDDHFETIVNAIEEGRTVFSNIKKFIAYILTSNIPEILPFIAFVVFGIPLPLTVVLILAIDLGTDLLPALGLGVESPEDDVMKMPPRPRNERLLSRSLLFMSYGVIGMIEAAAGFFSYFYVLFSGGWSWGQELNYTDPLYLKAVTAFFVSIVICQIVNVQVCRTRRESLFKKGIIGNRLVWLGILSEILLVWMITHIPVAQRIFGSTSLTPFEMALALPFAFLILFGDELRKAGLRRGNAFLQKYFSG